MWSFSAISPKDLDDIIAIERRSFKRPWSRLSFLNELAARDAYAYAAWNNEPENKGTLIGYVFFRLIADEMHLLKVATDARWRCCGIASGLMKKSMTLAVSKGTLRAYLEVRPSNRPAVGFYRKLGFDIIGRRKNYYTETGEDALVMSAHLGLEKDKSFAG